MLAHVVDVDVDVVDDDDDDDDDDDAIRFEIVGVTANLVFIASSAISGGEAGNERKGSSMDFNFFSTLVSQTLTWFLATRVKTGRVSSFVVECPQSYKECPS